MKTIQVFRESHTCGQGEPNVLTKEIYCNRYREFCKFIGDCPVKQTD